jgi:hypothetical protein
MGPARRLSPGPAFLMGSIAYAKHLHNDRHERRFVIAMATEGWELVEEADRQVVRHANYSDWHRVERARRAWRVKIDALKAEGWVERR